MKRALASNLQIMEGPVLSENQQLLDIADIQTAAEDMFGGLDVNHASLDVKIPQILTKELANNGLGLQMSGPGMGRGLVTHKPLAEAWILQCFISDIYVNVWLVELS